MREQNLKLMPVVSATESSGRVRHDDRGTAVWDWAVDTDALSSSGLLRRLGVANLKVQETPRLALAVTGRDAGGGGDPYNFRGAARRR